jgi:hypothetical protein
MLLTKKYKNSSAWNKKNDFTDGELGLPGPSLFIIGRHPQVQATCEEHQRDDTTRPQHGYDFSTRYQRIISVAPSAKCVFKRNKIVGCRIGMYAKTWSRDVDLLATQHVAKSWPYEKRTYKLPKKSERPRLARLTWKFSHKPFEYSFLQPAG